MTKPALRIASSIAGLMLASGATISRTEETQEAPAMLAGGGTGGMYRREPGEPDERDSPGPRRGRRSDRNSEGTPQSGRGEALSGESAGSE